MSKKLFTPLGIICAVLLYVFFYLFFSGPTGFIALEENDPLFDFPGVNAIKLREIAGVLEKANATLSAEPKLELVEIPLYPSNLWKAFAKVSELRETFFLNPSWRNAFVLWRSEYAAADAYESAAGYSLEIWDKKRAASTPPLKEEQVFQFLPGVITQASVFRGAILNIKNNGSALKKEMRKRFVCLLVGACLGGYGKNQIAHEIGLYDENSLSGVHFLPQPYLEFLQEAYGAVLLSEKFFGLRSPCFREDGRVSWFLLWRRNYLSGEKVFFPKLATNTFFRPINSESIVFPQDALVAEAKLPYTAQPETTLYMCPDLSYYTVLSTMLSFLNRVERKPLFSRFPPASPELKRISDAESFLIREKQLTENDFNRYVSLLRQYLAGKKDEDYSVIDREAGLMVRLWDTKSGGLEDIFMAVGMSINQYDSIVSGVSIPVLPVSTPLARGYPSLLFAPWNATVWRNSVLPAFVVFDHSVGGNSLRDFWTLRSLFSLSAIEQINSLAAAGSRKLLER